MNRTPRILLVDDEPAAIRRLTRLLEHEFENQFNIYSARTVTETRDLINQYQFDIVVLDIDLDGSDSFKEIVPILDQSIIMLVVSASPDRALEAFHVGITDYVTKPVTPARLKTAIARAMSRTIEIENHGHMLLDKSESIALRRVAYIEADGNYSQIVYLDGKRQLVTKSLNAFVDESHGELARIHRSYVTPADQLSEVLSHPGSRYDCKLKNGTTLPLGRSFVDNIRQLIK